MKYLVLDELYEDLRISGDFLIRAKNGKSVMIHGTVEIEGDVMIDCSLEAARIDVLGNLSVNGSVSSRELVMSGRFTCSGDVTSTTASIHGTVSVQGTLTYQKLDLNGSYKVGELVNTMNESISLYFFPAIFACTFAR
ncbi:MAG: polymer-forming cytoskeletal protein [Candidatus Odinarchaeota archaeon]